MIYISAKDLAAVVEVARFFTYAGQCRTYGWVSCEQLPELLKDEQAFVNWQRYERDKK